MKKWLFIILVIIVIPLPNILWRIGLECLDPYKFTEEWYKCWIHFLMTVIVVDTYTKLKTQYEKNAKVEKLLRTRQAVIKDILISIDTQDNNLFLKSISIFYGICRKADNLEIGDYVNDYYISLIKEDVGYIIANKDSFKMSDTINKTRLNKIYSNLKNISITK